VDDQRLRQLERAWEGTGDVAAGVAWLAENLRAGEISAEEVRVRAYLGDGLARHVLGPERPTRYDALPGFVERWYSEPLAPDYAAATRRLAELEAQHGPLSAALREWIVLTWGRECPFSQDYLLEPRRFPVGAGGHVPLFAENQGNFSYTSRLEDQAAEDDPRVWVDGAQQGVATSSEALMTGLLYETCWNGAEQELFGGGALLGWLAEGVSGALGQPRFEALAGLYSLLGAPLAPFGEILNGPRAEPEELRVYGDEDLLIGGFGTLTGEIFAYGIVRDASRMDELRQALDLD